MSGRRALLAGLTALLAGGVAAPAMAAPPFELDRTFARAGSGVRVDLKEAQLGTRPETFGSVVISLPRGMRLDTKSRKRRCVVALPVTLTATGRCPRASRIGFGHAVVNFRGYLFPGGETDAVAALVAYLAPPAVPGDSAAVIVEIRPLGVDAIRQAVFGAYGVFRPVLRLNWLGRIVADRTGRFGYELRFEQFPAGLQLPPPLSARITRLKLAIGAVRRLPKYFYRHFRVPTLKGDRVTTRTLRVRDHVLVPHHLLRNPRTCRGSWPWRVTVSFPEGPVVTDGRQSCKNGQIPILPPRSPSAPQQSR